MPKLPLTNKTFYQGDGNPYKDIIKATEILQAELKKTATEAEKVAKSLAVQAKTNPKQTAQDYKQLSSTITDLGRNVEAANKANKEAERLDITKRKLLTEQAKLNARNTVAIQNQKKALREQAKESLGLVSAYDKLNKQLGTARKNAKNIAVQYGVTSKEFKKASREVLKLDSNIKKIDKSLGLSQRQVGNYGLAFKGAAGSLVGFAAGFVGIRQGFRVLSESLKTIANFEKAMDEVVAITGATNEEFDKLEKNALKLGATTSKTAIEVAGLQKEFAKLGFSTDEILNATEATISLSIAAGSDLAESAVVAASTVRGFGLSAVETQRVVDVMAKSFSSSALDLEKFKVAMATVAPIARASGKDIEFTSARLSVLADAGIDASTAGTSLRNIFLELNKRGLTFEEGLRKINESTNKNITALDLFGKRGATAALVLAENTEKAEKLEKAYDDATGSAEEMARIMEDNLIGDTKLLTSAWDGFILGLNSGEGSITRVFRGLTQWLTNVVNLMSLANMTYEEIVNQTKDETLQAALKEDAKEVNFLTERYSEFLEPIEASRRAIDSLIESLENTKDAENANVELINQRIEALERLKLSTLERFKNQEEEEKNAFKEITTLKSLSERLSELNAEKKEININDTESLINKQQEINLVQEQIDLYSALFALLKDKPEDIEIKLDVDVGDENIDDIFEQLSEDRLNSIKAGHAEYQKLESENYNSILGIFFKYKRKKIQAEQGLTNAEKKEQIERNKKQEEATEQLASTLTSIYSQILESRLNQIQSEIDATNQKINEQQLAVSREYELLKQGAANEFNTEKEKLEKLQAQRDKDLQEKKKIQEKQRTIDTLIQVSSLATAIANIIEGFSEIPIVGVVLGLAAAAAAVAGFASYKSDAESAAYGEEGGVFEKKGTFIEGGKRHSKGGNKYSSAEFEQGEAHSIFSRKATSKYKDEIYNITNALNNDEWEMYKASLATLNTNNVIVNDYSKLLKEQQLTNNILRSTKQIVIDKNGNKHLYTSNGIFLKSN